MFSCAAPPCSGHQGRAAGVLDDAEGLLQRYRGPELRSADMASKLSVVVVVVMMMRASDGTSVVVTPRGCEGDDRTEPCGDLIIGPVQLAGAFDARPSLRPTAVSTCGSSDSEDTLMSGALTHETHVSFRRVRSTERRGHPLLLDILGYGRLTT